MKVLIVDDDAELADMLAYVLRRHGHHVIGVNDGESALRIWEREQPDVILLDVRMPRADGWQVLTRVRSQSQVPILMISGRADEDDVIQALNMGADDYVLKSFSPRQLIARIQAVLRRSVQAGLVNRDPTNIKSGDFELDAQRHEVHCEGRTARLTKIEFRLLFELASHESQVMTHQVLIDRVWGYQELSDSSLLKTHIRHLREKIEPEPSNPVYITTVPGVGYSFRSPKRGSGPSTNTTEQRATDETPKLATDHATPRPTVAEDQIARILSH